MQEVVQRQTKCVVSFVVQRSAICDPFEKLEADVGSLDLPESEILSANFLDAWEEKILTLFRD